ncbi:transposase family protein [Candidatus Bathyarchaeota archaeon]|nr:transposase family protein [Candidatus Bathyarchaeota archaeon]
MVKLNERKIRWIIQQKLRGRGAGELALIQRVSHRRVEQLWQTYRRTGTIPTLGTPGRPKGEPIRLHDAALVLKVYDELKVNALTLERVLRDIYQVKLPHNTIHMVLKEAGRDLPEPSKQRRRKWVRYEREQSMSLWHTDWKQLSDGRWWIAYMDDASRLILGYGVFQEATAENTIQVLKYAIARYGCPGEILTDRGSQFYASEGERKEKGVSRFEAYLAERGIKHLLARVNHPQTNGKLERFYGVYEQKQHQFKSIEEYVEWHNTIKPHLSLNIETLETPIQAFQRKLPLEKTEKIETTEPLVKK